MENAPYCVLVVDDSRFIRNLIRQSLETIEGTQMDIIEATNGQEALEFLNDKVEMVITDMNMPLMGGLELIQKIREKGLSDLPVLFITSVTDNEEKIKAFKLGATDYLTKPFLAPELQSRTMGYLERRRAFNDLTMEIEARRLAEEALRTSFETIKRQQQEMEEDLVMAEEVQKQLLSTSAVPPFLKIATRYLPFSHVSGDIYHLRDKPDGKFEIFLGDGTGHGVAAALTTIMANMSLKQGAAETSLGKIFYYLNHTFEESLPDDRFMSAVLATISEDGFLVTANAGHPPLLVIPADGGEPVELKKKGMLLGLVPNSLITFEEATYTLQPGDRGFFYTDGITEAKTMEGEMFGVERLGQYLRKHSSQEELIPLINHLLEHLNDYSQGAPPDDDITIVAFEYSPS